MNKYLIIFIVILNFLLISCEEEDKEVIIENPVLRLCITNILEKETDDKIYESETSEIQTLKCIKEKIYNINGIKKLKNIETLHLLGAYADEDFTEIKELKKLKELILIQYHKSHNFLSDLLSLEALSLFPTYTDDLSMIEGLKLKALEIRGENNHISYDMLSSIARITSLEKLFLDTNKISSLSFVENLINLKFLKIDYNEIKDLTPLENLINLEELNLVGNYEITDLSPIKNLTKLKNLILAGLKITDLSALENLVNLEILHAYYNHELSDILGIRNSIKLKELKLDENIIVDISALRNFVNLEYLEIQLNNIVDISPLENLLKMTYLDLNSNEIIDITPLSKLINLTLLNLARNYNAIGEAALGTLINLERLITSSTSIKTFGFLENLSKIDEIDLSGNKIVSLDGIEKAIYLRSLDLGYNYINDLSKLSSLQLRYLRIYKNCVTDFTPIEHIWELYGNSLEDQRETCDIPEE